MIRIIILKLAVVLFLSGCSVGTYIEKSYRFIDYEIMDGGIDGDSIEDNINEKIKLKLYFTSGDMHFYLTHRTLTGPYRMRLDIFCDNNSDTYIKEIEIEKIEIKNINKNIVPNIYEIIAWNWDEIKQIRDAEIEITDLVKFYNAKKISIPEDIIIRRILMRFEEIDISYNKIEELDLEIKMKVTIENGAILIIDKNYILKRIKREYVSSWH
jgi:hypothetical protein